MTPIDKLTGTIYPLTQVGKINELVDAVNSGGGGGGGYTLPVASTSTLGGVKIDGTTVTIDENGVISSSGDNKRYIAPGTYVIKIDGTGDFASLNAAVSYLSGKWSDGIVTFSLVDTGYYDLTATLGLNGLSFNIPQVRVINGSTNTRAKVRVLNGTFAAFNIINGSDVALTNLEITQSPAQKQSSGISCSGGAKASISNCTVGGFATGVYSGWQGNCVISSNLTVSNCTTGITCENDSKVMMFPMTLTLSSLTTGISIARLSTVCAAAVTYSVTSVSTRCNITRNTFNASGVFYSDTAL